MEAHEYHRDRLLEVLVLDRGTRERIFASLRPRIPKEEKKADIRL